MTDRELMQQALETLQEINKLSVGENAICLPAEIDTSMDALRERLKQPEQEPFEYWNAVEGWVKVDEVRQHFDSVGCGTIYKTAGEDRVPVYTTPPQRPWVGLTNKDIIEMWPQTSTVGWDDIRLIEAKLRSKNT